MHDYAQDIHTFIKRLLANPRIELYEQDFDFHPDSPQGTARTAAFYEKEFGFAPEPQDWQLLNFPQSMSVEWKVKSAVVLPGGFDSIVGQLNLFSLSTSLSDDSLSLHVGAELASLTPYARYFDPKSSLDMGIPAVQLYDKDHRHYLGVGVFLRPEIEPLELTTGAYLRAALAWHGATGWQLLYCPLARFEQLHLSERRLVYRLPVLLPFLFPDADWSILDTKREYFAYEQVDRESGQLVGLP